MIYVKDLTEITTVKYSIGFTHFMPMDNLNGLGKTQDELLMAGKLVELPVELPPVDGKSTVMYYNPIDNTCFWEYADIPPSPDDEIASLKANLESANQSIGELTSIVLTLMV